MNTNIKIKTGDTKYGYKIRHVCIELDKTESLILFSVDEWMIKFPVNRWAILEILTRSRSLRGCSESDFKEISIHIDSTAVYQLILSAIEISSIVNLMHTMDGLDFNIGFIKGRFIPLGSNGLYFLPKEMIDIIDSSILNELVKLNKLCCATIEYDSNKHILYYVPYATPVKEKLSKDAKRVWENIREMYIEARDR